MSITICEGDIHLVNLRTRMPFKYGIATMTRMPMAFVRLAIEVDGQPSLGVAADLLPPKWFTKDPDRDCDEEVHEMLAVIRHAMQTAVTIAGNSPFDTWHELYAANEHWRVMEDVPPLLAHFGTSMIERAMLDAFCRTAGRPFYRLLASDQLGIDLSQFHPALRRHTPSDLLSPSPLKQIIARHTVGMADPLTDEEIPADEILNDGLPQSLEACVRHYGLCHFKLKINGNLDADRDRLQRIAAVLDAHAPPDYQFTLDGNEQFKSIAGFQDYWQQLSAVTELKDFLPRLIFVEQPLHRLVALEEEVGQTLRNWETAPPIIIDESDATTKCLARALDLGYSGTSHKNCKGVFKGIANRCRLLQLQQENPNVQYLMSGEDLCNVGPVSLLQDLAVCAALGIASVERNGHHYNAGLSKFPPGVQEQVLRAHGDLYRRSEAGWPTLHITNGKINVTSLNESPFGMRFLLDTDQFTPADQWQWP